MSAPETPDSGQPEFAQADYDGDRLEGLQPSSWENPQPDAPYQLLVIGAGPAGLVAATAAAYMGARVGLIERDLIGGVSLNTGAAPSKALIRTADLYAEMRDARQYGGVPPRDLDVDFAAVMRRVRQIRAHLSHFYSVRRLTAAGIDLFFGAPRFRDRQSVAVGGQIVRFEKALIATGARRRIPDIPGLVEAGYFTSDDIFEQDTLPRRLLVIGGGAQGCELAQAFARLGSQVTIVQDKSMFLPGEERDAAQILADAFARDGIAVRLNTKAVAVRAVDGEKQVDLISDDYRNTIVVDAILTGTGYQPNVEGLDLSVAGVDYDAEHGIHVDDFLCTTQPIIYAAGDVGLQSKYAHTAAAAARLVVHNALFAGNRRMSALVVPWCTFTDPEIAHVGLYVRQANELGIPVKTYTIPMHEVSRAMMDSEQDGFVKVHVREGSDHILGATIVAKHAGDMINEITLAMQTGIGLRKLSSVIHAYPTQAEGIRMAADALNRARFTPKLRERLKGWLGRRHRR